jgi:hypothetical protein
MVKKDEQQFIDRLEIQAGPEASKALWSLELTIDALVRAGTPLTRSELVSRLGSLLIEHKEKV